MNCIPVVSSYPVIGDNYFCKDGDPHEVGIIVGVFYYSDDIGSRNRHLTNENCIFSMITLF